MPGSFLQGTDPEEAILDEDLAKLGDTLVNLIYSLARSMAQGEPDGAKASNKVLSESLRMAGLRNLAPSRIDRHRLGDITEAMIAFAWLQGRIEIEEAAEILSDSLREADFQSRREVLKASGEGFKNLLITISERISIAKDQISDREAGD